MLSLLMSNYQNKDISNTVNFVLKIFDQMINDLMTTVIMSPPCSWQVSCHGFDGVISETVLDRNDPKALSSIFLSKGNIKILFYLFG